MSVICTLSMAPQNTRMRQIWNQCGFVFCLTTTHVTRQNTNYKTRKISCFVFCILSDHKERPYFAVISKTLKLFIIFFDNLLGEFVLFIHLFCCCFQNTETFYLFFLTIYSANFVLFIHLFCCYFKNTETFFYFTRRILFCLFIYFAGISKTLKLFFCFFDNLLGEFCFLFIYFAVSSEIITSKFFRFSSNRVEYPQFFSTNNMILGGSLNRPLFWDPLFDP
jgi:hypothetical protein